MKRRGCIFIIMTLLLITMILFCAVETVASQGRDGDRCRKLYYSAMEKEYLFKVEKKLGDMGYPYSGITIRWVSDSDGARSYTVMIHHRKINMLDVQEKKALLDKISADEFDAEGCTFNYELITT